MKQTIDYSLDKRLIINFTSSLVTVMIACDALFCVLRIKLIGFYFGLRRLKIMTNTSLGLTFVPNRLLVYEMGHLI